jgi:hypothetical protein
VPPVLVLAVVHLAQRVDLDETIALHIYLFNFYDPQKIRTIGTHVKLAGGALDFAIFKIGQYLF